MDIFEALAFFSGAMSHAPNFFPFFLTGVHAVGSGLVFRDDVKYPKQKFILKKVNYVLLKTQEKDFHFGHIRTNFWPA